jgi:phosphonate transport system permease protein
MSTTMARPFQSSLFVKCTAVAGLLYVAYALGQLNFSLDRFVIGIGNGGRFLARMFPPDISRLDILYKGIVESLQIGLLASFVGIVISMPLAFLAARNVSPAWLSWITRAAISGCRSLHPVIVAILFVKAVGFGALAGILALSVASIGFIGKLFSEAIEEISLKQVEAIRATGASLPNVIIFGILPQVWARFIGFSTYQLDSNLRNSTMVGIVGAGGIGGALFAAFQRFDYDFVFTILATIIAIIVVTEIAANYVKKILNV